ncbi:PRC-barrel domain-containing protein [Brevundimonas sp.]|uniref:PRC-barrel domain-containing protein n=2 Tax=Brevundimonas TaxID=41275 RepID=UPI002897B7F5|nr:PRC-barrel domain-containing protein [Brevundimonas sp.]
MDEAAGWAAPVATAVAAVMTASNLGPRVTGWGFVVFFAGSICWCVVAVQTDQPNLLWANGFLTLVNLAGVWRWLGRQARYQQASARASAASERSKAPDLVALSAVLGGRVQGSDGEIVGHVVEVMARRDSSAMAYLVVSVGGLGGVGETLRALDRTMIVLTPEGAHCRLSREAVESMPALSLEQWPAGAADVRAGQDARVRQAERTSAERR